MAMLRGHIDSVTSFGYIEGWAFDQDDPTKALEVSIHAGAEEVAWGLALGFRKDLMDAGLGLGWCAFRLRLLVPIENPSSGPFELIERKSGANIFSKAELNPSVDGEEPLSSIDMLVNADPTIIRAIRQLRQCESVLAQFMRRYGVEAFIDAAFAYVLGRAADHQGRMQYTKAIRQATLTSVGLLEVLENSDEFRSKVRQLASPKSPAFPFI